MLSRYGQKSKVYVGCDCWILCKGDRGRCRIVRHLLLQLAAELLQDCSTAYTVVYAHAMAILSVLLCKSVCSGGDTFYTMRSAMLYEYGDKRNLVDSRSSEVGSKYAQLHASMSGTRTTHDNPRVCRSCGRADKLHALEVLQDVKVEGNLQREQLDSGKAGKLGGLHSHRRMVTVRTLSSSVAPPLRFFLVFVAAVDPTRT